MESLNNKKRIVRLSFFPFGFGYCIGFLSVIFLSYYFDLFSVKKSLLIIGEIKNTLLKIFITTPFFTYILAKIISKVQLGSVDERGTSYFTRGKNLGITTLSFLISNFVIITLSLRIFIDNEIGQKWIESIGGAENFNFIVEVLAPLVGIAIGFLFFYQRNRIDISNNLKSKYYE
jgi:hypothetical protein